MSKEIFSYVKLKDVADVEISSVDKKCNENETEVSLCNFVDVYYNWAVTERKAVSFMKATAKQSEIDRFALKKGQVAITKDSETKYDIGVATYIADDFDNVLLGYHCALITPNKNKLSGKYLNAFFHTKFVQKYFELNATGSGQRFTLSLDAIKDMPIYLPSLSKQEEIAEIFSKIDRKIELNETINDILEQQIKLLYDFWFNQFEYPNPNDTSIISSKKLIWNDNVKRNIPVDWLAVKVETVLEKVPTTNKIATSNYCQEGSIPVIDQSTDFIAGYTDDTQSLLKKDDGYIVFGDHTRIVKYIMFPFARGADGTQVLSSNTTRMPNELLYQAIRQIDLSNFGYARHFKFLKDTYILLPDEKTARLYCDIVKPLHRTQSELIFENINLCRIRDWLLPLLINGQATIGD